MITLVNGKGEQVNNFQFLDWEGAENCLREQRESGKDGVYLRGDFGTPILYDGIYYIAVEFGDYTGRIIKAKRVPCPDELMIWIKPDMEQGGYTEFASYYVTDEDDVYEGYDTENIDNWPVFGA